MEIFNGKIRYQILKFGRFKVFVDYVPFLAISDSAEVFRPVSV